MNKKQQTKKPFAFKIDQNLAKKFREVVSKSGYKQNYLIEKCMKKIIEELEREFDND